MRKQGGGLRAQLLRRNLQGDGISNFPARALADAFYSNGGKFSGGVGWSRRMMIEEVARTADFGPCNANG